MDNRIVIHLKTPKKTAELHGCLFFIVGSYQGLANISEILYGKQIKT